LFTLPVLFFLPTYSPPHNRHESLLNQRNLIFAARYLRSAVSSTRLPAPQGVHWHPNPRDFFERHRSISSNSVDVEMDLYAVLLLLLLREISDGGRAVPRCPHSRAAACRVMSTNT
jgi:hypothetical protein